MAINYIVKGIGSLAAAEKIKIALIEKNIKENPWLVHRLAPVAAEALKTGGGIYRFVLPLGYQAAARRSAKPTSNVVNYEDTTVIEQTLTVSQPLVTPVYAFENADMKQLDGIDFSAISTKKVNNVLIKARIAEDTKAMTGTTGYRTEDLTAITDVLEKIEAIKNLDSDYDDISEANGWGTTATRHFDAGSGVLEERYIHMHPHMMSLLSNVNTEAGAGSELQYAEFTSGRLSAINGTPVIKNKTVDKNTVWIAPAGILGTPDDAVMMTKVIVSRDDLNDIDRIKGMEWYDSINIAPELITQISFAAATKKTKAEKVEVKAKEDIAKAEAKAVAEAEVAKAKAAAEKAQAEAKMEKAQAKENK